MSSGRIARLVGDPLARSSKCFQTATESCFSEPIGCEIEPDLRDVCEAGDGRSQYERQGVIAGVAISASLILDYARAHSPKPKSHHR